MADQTPHDDDYTDQEIAEELANMECRMTVEEIWEAGYRTGHASTHSSYQVPFRRWLARRRENRGW